MELGLILKNSLIGDLGLLQGWRSRTIRDILISKRARRGLEKTILPLCSLLSPLVGSGLLRELEE
jgi:hypothetical protein